MILEEEELSDILVAIKKLQNVVINHLVEWFHKNYEDPVESQPVDSGDFVWLVSKCDAREELEENFLDVSEDLIILAVEQIESDGTTEWVSLAEMDEAFTK